MPVIDIRDLRRDEPETIEAVARLLVEGFREHWPDAWPEMEDARAEIFASFEPERISRVAIASDGEVLGWIGGLLMAPPHVWELHPLVVAGTVRGRGVGSTLVEDLEDRVRERGGTTVFLGTDDDDLMTSLGGVDLYPDPLVHLAALKDLRGHPFGFYQRLGYAVSGVIPDANGPGKHDILMTKRLGPRRA